jgi:hypothetical protein
MPDFFLFWHLGGHLYLYNITLDRHGSRPPNVMPHAPPDDERTFRQDNNSSFSVVNIPVETDHMHLG